MTAPTPYFTGQEDSEFQLAGGASIITTSGRFIATKGGANIARCAIKCANGDQVAQAQNQGGSANMFSITSGWFHAHVWMQSNSAVSENTRTEQAVFRITDSLGITRLAILCLAGNGGVPQASTAPSLWGFYKATAAGTYTQLGAAFSATFSGAPSLPDKLDVQIISYGATGSVNIYINDALVFAVSSVALATDSNTALNGVSVSGVANSTRGSGSWCEFDWSDIIVSDTDTRSLLTATRPPVSNGTTHNFDTGTPAAANVNEITRDDTTFDGSTTAAQIDGYTIDTTLPAGYGISWITVSGLLQAGATGPTKMDQGVGISGTYYWGSDLTLGASMQPWQTFWVTSPATAVSWAAIPGEVALKSVA